MGSVKSELTDPLNRNQAKCNLPTHQLAELWELIQLQKDKQIIIKRCDKGAGIIILDYNDYISACNKHLSSKQVLKDGTETPFYTEVEPEFLGKSKAKINLILQEALDNQVISKDDCEAMNPDARNAGKFNLNFKVHTPQLNIPPERAIVSQCDSVTSNIGKFVDYQIQDPSRQHNSYLEDTPDFIHRIEKN